jgi:hypothetical protein
MFSLQMKAHRITGIQLDLDQDIKYNVSHFSHFHVYFVTEKQNTVYRRSLIKITEYNSNAPSSMTDKYHYQTCIVSNVWPRLTTRPTAWHEHEMALAILVLTNFTQNATTVQFVVHKHAKKTEQFVRASHRTCSPRTVHWIGAHPLQTHSPSTHIHTPTCWALRSYVSCASAVLLEATGCCCLLKSR